MKINIKSINFKIGQKLSEIAHSKVKKFMTLCQDCIMIEVKLIKERSAQKINKACGIRLVIPGNDMLTYARCNTFEEALARSVEGMERQIEKRKKKLIANRLNVA